MIFLGADHRGFALKETLKRWLEGQGYEVQDLGASSLVDGDDYVDYARIVAERVSEGKEARGIVICGSGVGVDVTANKVKTIRSTLGFAEEQVREARADDDSNVLALAADFTEQSQARQLVQIFLETPFKKEERYLRRLKKIESLEQSV